MIPQVLFNTNLFVDGINFKGDVPSLSLPKLVVKTDEYRGGGMAGPVEMDMGLEKMEASFTTNGVRREAMKFLGCPIKPPSTGFIAVRSKGKKGRPQQWWRPCAACSKSWTQATGSQATKPSSSTRLLSATTSWRSLAASFTKLTWSPRSG